VQRLHDLSDRFHGDTVEAAVDWFVDSSAKRFREEIAKWPDGVFEAEAFADHDPWGNRDVRITVTVTVDGDRISVDFEGTDARPELQAWSSFGNARGFTITQIAAMLDPAIPKNEGFLESIVVRIPYGCVLNPPYGKPVSAGTHHLGTELGDAIALALAHVAPEGCVPQTYKTGIPTVINGTDPHNGQPFTDHSAEVYAG